MARDRRFSGRSMGNGHSKQLLELSEALLSLVGAGDNFYARRILQRLDAEELSSSEAIRLLLKLALVTRRQPPGRMPETDA